MNTKKLFAAFTSAILCTVPMLSMITANAAETEQSKTYVVYHIAQNSSIAYFDFSINYDSDVIANESTATSLLDGGYFRSTNNETSRKVQNTYNGDAIGGTGVLTSTKLYAPMTTTSIFDKITYTNPVIRNASNITLSPTSITMEAILLGDANQDGVVDSKDADAISAYIANPSASPLSAAGLDAADVQARGNGLNANDVLMIQQYIGGYINNF
ncbi:MAG: dockerin type I repeat-containing protein [Ruminococcus sp.]|nr:dockerin type I repeat-containing protein [Ruminococcus sp.]MBQ8297337.1 dockerin type I repeat-containing protein [Ruminococcus sp.]